MHVCKYVCMCIRNSTLDYFPKIKLNPNPNFHPFRQAGYLILVINTCLSHSYAKILDTFDLCCHNHFPWQPLSKKVSHLQDFETNVIVDSHTIESRISPGFSVHYSTSFHSPIQSWFPPLLSPPSSDTMIYHFSYFIPSHLEKPRLWKATHSVR